MAAACWSKNKSIILTAHATMRMLRLGAYKAYTSGCVTVRCLLLERKPSRDPRALLRGIVCLTSQCSIRFTLFLYRLCFRVGRLHPCASFFQHRHRHSRKLRRRCCCAGIMTHLHLLDLCHLLPPPSMSGAAPTPPDPSTAPLPLKRKQRTWSAPTVRDS